MQTKKILKNSKNIQTLLGVLMVLLVAFLAFLFKNVIGYKVVALLLLMTVSILAMFFDIIPVLFAAFLSALIWNYFFIPPIFTLHINNTEDLLLFFMYFIIASVHAVLTFRIRKQEAAVREKEDKENTIRLYDTLLNCLSHELRTPISTIIGAVDTLKEKSLNLSQKNQDQLLNEIDKAGLILNRQVENLLNMSRLESGMLHANYIWCDLNELVFTVINGLTNSLNDEFIINFVSKEPIPLVKTDIVFMVQVIHNLVYNAIMHLSLKPKIAIEVSVWSNYFQIIISDNGPGFSEDEIDKVFEKFYRLPNAKTGGTGLGLSIVKGFVTALGGTIVLENNIQGGAKFTIKVPAEISYLNHLKNE